jgi:C_GCAxxG_C_C family probable redox protein
MTRREAAMANFLKGYNCSQSIILAFADMLPIDESTLMKMASSFGGGMGRLREVCGSVSGMFMIAGLLYGYDGPETGQIKADHYARIQELAHRFEEKHGTIICREMLGLNVRHDEPVPEARTKEYYRKRPCAEIIGDAAEILDQYLKEYPCEKSLEQQ